MSAIFQPDPSILFRIFCRPPNGPSTRYVQRELLRNVQSYNEVEQEFLESLMSKGEPLDRRKGVTVHKEKFCACGVLAFDLAERQRLWSFAASKGDAGWQDALEEFPESALLAWT